MTTAERKRAVSSLGNRLLRLAEALFVVLLAFLAAGATVSIAGTVFSTGGVERGTIPFTVGRTIAQFVGFALAAVGLVAVTDAWGLLQARSPTRREAGLIVAGVVCLLAAQFGALAVLEAVGIEVGQNRAVTVGEGEPLYYLAMIPVSVLVVGPVEELLFRGTVQGGLRRVFDAGPAIVIASVIFGAVHVSGVEGSALAVVAYIGIATLLALPLGYLYELTGNLVVPALAHGFYNASLFAIQYGIAVGAI